MFSPLSYLSPGLSRNDTNITAFSSVSTTSDGNLEISFSSLWKNSTNEMWQHNMCRHIVCCRLIHGDRQECSHYLLISFLVCLPF